MKKRNYFAVILSFFNDINSSYQWTKTNVIADNGPKQVDAAITNFRFMNLSRTNVEISTILNNFYL